MDYRHAPKVYHFKWCINVENFANFPHYRILTVRKWNVKPIRQWCAYHVSTELNMVFIKINMHIARSLLHSLVWVLWFVLKRCCWFFVSIKLCTLLRLYFISFVWNCVLLVFWTLDIWHGHLYIHLTLNMHTIRSKSSMKYAWDKKTQQTTRYAH